MHACIFCKFNSSSLFPNGSNNFKILCNAYPRFTTFNDTLGETFWVIKRHKMYTTRIKMMMMMITLWTFCAHLTSLVPNILIWFRTKKHMNNIGTCIRVNIIFQNGWIFFFTSMQFLELKIVNYTKPFFRLSTISPICTGSVLDTRKTKINSSFQFPFSIIIICIYIKPEFINFLF